MPVASPTFRWTKAYSVNIEALDRQHEQLINTINELDQALRAGEGNSALDPLLDKLVKYSVDHFAAEEALMEWHQFPGLPTHRTQHEMFRRKLADFIACHKAHKAGVPVSLMLFMREWLKDHLLKTDKQYSAFLNARGVR
ncbi:MAG TPA: bacteriohemerythrin [Candidatus Dormibacteraeota bacterium]|nr:bacteriohemerythrin [Candidatus Dormibacteraeota bacterium]